MIIRKFLAMFALYVLTYPTAWAAETLSGTTPRGVSITVVRDFPEGNGPFPAVILGPGRGSLKQKINEAVANTLKERGFAIFRFDWAYFVKDPNGAPSDTDLAPEIEDFATVIALAKSDSHVDSTNIVVDGKSLGTIIAWRVFRSDSSLKGLLQLTPVCNKEGFSPDQIYPDREEEKRPSLWIAGDVDSWCDIKGLYRLLLPYGGLGRLAILRGDHGLGIPETSALAGSLSADFVAAITAPDKH